MTRPGRSDLPPLAVTMGEPAGIGPEIILDSWIKGRNGDLPPFLVVGDAAVLEAAAGMTGRNVPIERTSAEQAAAVFAHAVPVVETGENAGGRPGKLSPGDGAAICGWISEAVRMVHDGQASAIVTAPINKHALYEAGFRYPGHTEFLAALSGEIFGVEARPVMMLAGPELRTVPVTIHIPICDVPAALDQALIEETIRITDHDLKTRFGLANPRIAVSGLNPHAGENGSMGKEDDATIRPAIEALRHEGINAFGPLPADTMFHARAREAMDVAVCMYHDQALIPAKTLGFDDAVNVTLGLPFIRTSPDHGTALDIAGKGKASPSSMIAAINLAAKLAAGGSGANGTADG